MVLAANKTSETVVILMPGGYTLWGIGKRNEGV